MRTFAGDSKPGSSHEREQLPLAVDLALAAQREAIEPPVVAQVSSSAATAADPCLPE
jgi:hypothetical protein